jgi:hypothetical protein
MDRGTVRSRPGRPAAAGGAAATLVVVLSIVLSMWLGVSAAQAQDSGSTTTVATTPQGEPICVGCHEGVSLNVVITWRDQSHGRNGVGCQACHNTHDQDFTPHPLSGVCFGCHDVAAIHPDFTVETPAARCMECHTANIHWRADSSSWFYGGLPRDALAGSQEETQGVSASAGRAVGFLVVALALALGLVIGFVVDRFVRGL